MKKYYPLVLKAPPGISFIIYIYIHDLKEIN